MADREPDRPERRHANTGGWAPIDQPSAPPGEGLPRRRRRTGGVLPWKQEALRAERERLEAGRGTRERREAEDWENYQEYLKDRRKNPKKEETDEDQDKDNEAQDGGRDEAAEKEAEKLGDKEGFYKPDRERGVPASKRYIKNRRRITIVGGLIGVLGGGSIALTSIFLPVLRLDSYLANINRRAFGYAAAAIEERLSFLFESYLVAHAISLERCGPQATIDCRADYTDQGIAAGLFRTWQDVKIEEQLFDKFGISVEFDASAQVGEQRYLIRDRFGRQLRFNTVGELHSGLESGGSRGVGAHFRRQFRYFQRGAMSWQEVNQRRVVRKYFRRKHNMRLWCFFACQTRDDIELRRSDIRTRWRFFFTKRFIYPFSSKLGIIMDCLTSGGGRKCTPQGLRERGIDRDVDVEFMNRIRGKVQTHPNRRFFQIVMEEIIEKIFARQGARQAARTALSFIPIAGQVYFVIVVVDMLDRFDSFIANHGLTHFATDLNMRQMLEFYQGMRAAGDEIKSHVMSFAEVGEIMTQFDGAEQSLIYKALHNGQGAAVQRADDPYRCPSGKRIPEGMLVCPEYTMTRTFVVEDIRSNDLVSGLMDVINGYGRCYGVSGPGDSCGGLRPRDIIRPVLNGINELSDDIVGPALRTAMSGVEALPSIGSFISRMQQIGMDIVFAFLEKVYPLPVRIGSAARELYDGLEGGGAAAAYEFCMGGYTEDNDSYGLGCSQVTGTQATEIFQEYMAQEEYSYKKSSIRHKLTDLSYGDSFMNNLLEITPNNLSEAPGHVLANFSNIFGNIIGSFSRKPVRAQGQLPSDPFDIPRYGYPLSDGSFVRPPNEYTDEFCSTMRTAWENSRTEDPVSGLENYSATNPCLLEEGTVEAGSLFFTTN